MKKNIILLLMAMMINMAMSVGDIHAQVIKAPKKTTATTQAKKKTTAKPVQPKPATVFKLNGNENDFTLSVEPSGGIVEMNVITNASTYTIDQMPSFCKLQSQMGGTFTIKCDPNRTSQSRSETICVSVQDGKQVVVTLQQKGYEVPSSVEFSYTLYGITLGKTTYGEMESKGFSRRDKYITTTNWKGLSMACYSFNCYRHNSANLPQTITQVLVQWNGKKSFPEEWVRAGAPSGEINYYQWKVFLEKMGFSIKEKEEINSAATYLAKTILNAENEKLDVKIEVESETYRRNSVPNPGLSTSDVGISSFSVKHKHW